MPSESSLFTSDQEHQRLLNALRESEILREISALLASSLDLNAVLRVLVQRTAEACGVERCAVWLLHSEQRLLLPQTYHLTENQIDQRTVLLGEAAWYRSSLSLDIPLIQRLFTNDGIVTVDDLSAEPGMDDTSTRFLVRSALFVALLREGRPLGIMSLDSPSKAVAFTPEMCRLAYTIGQQAAVAIENAQLFHRVQTERRRAERLIERAQSVYSVAMAVNSGEDLIEVLHIAIERLIVSLAASGGAIALLRESDGDAAAIVASHGLTLSARDQQSYVPLSELPSCEKVIQDGTPLFLSSRQMETCEREWYNCWGLENILIVPLMIGNDRRKEHIPEQDSTSPYTQCIGFIFVTYQQTPSPSKGEIAFVQDIAAQCALAVQKNSIIAEAHKATALALERAQTLNAVFNALNEGIMVFDDKGQVIMTNNTAKHFLGMPEQKWDTLKGLTNNYPITTLHGQRLGCEEFPVTRALRGEHIRGERFVTRRADSSERVVEVTVVPFDDEEARPMGVVSAFRDVTVQMRAEGRLRHALETMLCLAEEVSGLTESEDILRRALALAVSVVNCERGVAYVFDQEHQLFTPLFSSGFSPSEEKLWEEARQQLLTSGGAAYQSIHEQVLQGHAIMLSEEQFPDLAGALQHTTMMVVPVHHHDTLLGVMLLDGSSQQPSALNQRASSIKQRRRCEFTVWDMALAEGIAQLTGLAIEVARWQREVESARMSEAAMREANKAKDEFLAITAHEFRSPLTVILAQSQRLLRKLKAGPEGENREKLQEIARNIGEQTNHLTNIVNTFLEVSHLNRGKITLNREIVDLTEVMIQAVENCSATTHDHDIDYCIEPAERPYRVWGDQARLQQVFANLLQNAVKYSLPGGPVTVSLRQRTAEDGTRMIEVRVKDEGIGIPREAQDRLFERFYRAPNILGTKTSGIGLGLYIVAQFLHLHGGSIKVESSGEYGEGSTFIFTLPLLERDSRDTEAFA